MTSYTVKLRKSQTKTNYTRQNKNNLDKLACNFWHSVKVGRRTWDPKPPNPGTPSKFKSGTWDAHPLMFKNRTLGSPPQSLKVGPPRLRRSLINSFFFRIYFFPYLLFSPFLNNKHNSRPYLVS